MPTTYTKEPKPSEMNVYTKEESGGYLLQETRFFLLLEDGFKIIIDGVDSVLDTEYTLEAKP